MDAYILEDPTAGVLTMQDMLSEKGYKAGYERVRRMVRLAGIRPIYPRRHLTVLGDKKYIHPYLLRDLAIAHSNQVWALDITYVPMQQGFMYLTAIMDVYSRKILTWGLSNTQEANASLQVVQNAINQYGKPEILKSDQGSQNTSAHWVDTLTDLKIKISMDGKGRASVNAFIERWFRTLEQKHIYLNIANDGIALYKGIHNWIERYNMRKHQGTVEKLKVRYQNAA
jgi:putative transposase